jgi:hypothetical protein
MGAGKSLFTPHGTVNPVTRAARAGSRRSTARTFGTRSDGAQFINPSRNSRTPVIAGRLGRPPILHTMGPPR